MSWRGCVRRTGESHPTLRRDVQFSAVLQLNGKTATGSPVPAEVLTALGGGRGRPGGDPASRRGTSSR